MNLIPPTNGTRTSNEAADGAIATAHYSRARILSLLQESHAGATDEEMQDALSMSGSTQRPRRGELEKMGLIYNTNTTRKTKSGRNAFIWKAA